MMNKYLRELVTDWAVRSFGEDHVVDERVRAKRLLEETLELCQSLDVPVAEATRVVEVVYSRPSGYPEQEVGGVMVTLAILCEQLGIDPEEEFRRELRRILDKPAAEFARRNAEKNALGLS